MTNRCLKLGAVLLSVLATAQLCPAQSPAASDATTMPAPAQGVLLTALRTRWENTRNLVLGISKIVPEDKYDYRATPDVRSFRELFIHIAQEGYRFMAPVAGETPPDMSGLTKLTSRDDLLKAMTDSYDYGEKIIASLTDEQANEMVTGGRGGPHPRWTGILDQIIDNMDHYGNLVTYVRINGLVPPRTAARGAMGAGKKGGQPPAQK